MNSLAIPLALAGLGLLAGLFANRGIRRGAARFYALERDAMLRRASITLLGSIALLALSVGLLAYQHSQLTAALNPEEDSAEQPVAVPAAEPTTPVIEALPPRTTTDSTDTTTNEPIVLNQPPTLAAEPTLDLTLPTAEPTPIIRRGVIEGTAGSGANLRSAPSVSAEEIEVLDDGTVVTLVDGSDEVEANNYTWVNIRTGTGTDGWVVKQFLTVTSTR